MTKGCKVVAEVTVDGVAFMGHPANPGLYFCAQAVTFSPPVQAVVCATSQSLHVAGRWLQDEAAKEVSKTAMENGCNLVVEVTEGATKYLVVQGAKAASDLQNAKREAVQTYAAINTTEGMHWLMMRLSGR